MASQHPQLEHLGSLLPPSEIFAQGQKEFAEQSTPWSIHAEQHPKLVVQPTTLDGLQKAVKFLYDSDLDFAVRNTGTGSVSAHEVILSMKGFKSFHFDKEAMEVTIGAGLEWGEVDIIMEKQASGYAVPSARCSWVGVAGSTLVGGLSWLSHEYGLISDPQNLLDMQIVLRDGRVLWASEEPELMWALRGGGGNFGVVTALKLRARPYTTTIFSGVLNIPYTSLKECSKAVAAMAAKPSDPKVAMHVVNQGPGMGMPDQGAKPGLSIIMFDALGEAHARNEAFAWAFKMPGAQELVMTEMTLQQVNCVTETFRVYNGQSLFWLCAPLISDVDDDLLVRVWKWYEDSINQYPGLGQGSNVLLEFMQENAMNSSGSRTATAWPHSGRKHVMQLLLGCKPEGAPANIGEIALRQFEKADRQIAGEKRTGEFHAGFLHEWNDLREVYGENYDKLKEVKQKYDPKNRFNKGVNLTDEKVCAGMTV